MRALLTNSEFSNLPPASTNSWKVLFNRAQNSAAVSPWPILNCCNCFWMASCDTMPIWADRRRRSWKIWKTVHCLNFRTSWSERPLNSNDLALSWSNCHSASSNCRPLLSVRASR
eukprot:Lithocolla_globosa_v1_NODE_2611_length_1935_cov_6.455851.p4 type:complete len:115 gc:universal NODE_2611_length_1935_cov_6.455851:1517-1861(+)